MTRVSHADHVLLLLREQLQRVERSRGNRAGRVAGTRAAEPRPLVRLQSLAALDQLSDEDLRRTLVRALLAERLGEGVANDPSFQSVVDDVYRIIRESEEGRELIEKAARQLRS